MKYLLLSPLIIFLFTISMAQDKEVKTGTLIVTIEGLQNNKGKVRIAVGNSEKNYSDNGALAFRGGDSEISNKAASIVFDEMPYGYYAVKVFHDENNNDELDSNFLSVPQEPYGFSNNVRGTFGPASWDDAKFEINRDTLAISIKVE